MPIEAVVREAITKIAGIEAQHVRLDATLEDLGIDSLTAAEMLVEMEIQLGRQFPIDVLRRLDDATTVRDIVDQLGPVLGSEPLSAE
jgi:acyl carrier protein